MAENNLLEIFDGLNRKKNALRSGRFIMSNNNISQLLRYIASNAVIVNYVTDSNEVVDYHYEFNNAIINVGTSKIFKLPKNERKIVALITGLLFDFDRGTIDILSFLKDYFCSNDIDVSFSMFCDQIIDPYIDAFNNIVVNKPTQYDDDEEDIKVLPQAVREQIIPFIISLTEQVVQDNGLSDVKRQEYLNVLEGMCYVIEDCNTKILKAMWIGLKYTMVGFRLGNSFLNGIDIILKNYSII